MNKLRDRNESSKKKKITIICIVLMFIAIGFAALSATLGITADARIAKVNWGVHFENLEVSKDSIEAISPATILSDDTTKASFDVLFTEPGQYYEFEVEVVNSGNVDAKLSSLQLDGFTSDKAKYLTYTILYMDGTQLRPNDLLKAGDRDRIKFRLEFRYDLTNADLPDEGTIDEFTLNLTFTQDRGTGVQRKKYMYRFNSKFAYLDNMASQYVESENGIDFRSNSSDTNGRGLYVKAETKNDEYPIYYYRGEVDNNNVIFAGLCWQIVRTTETGGTKLIYNGVSNSGVCDSTGEAKTIGRSVYNEKNNSLSDIGYMYGERYEMQGKDMTSVDITGMKFANDVHWNGSQYELVDYIEGTSWSSDYSSINNNHHYTCLSTENVCDTVYYILQANPKNIIYTNSGFTYIELANGKTLETAKEDMFRNTNDSVLKKVLDEWYENHLSSYTEYLEKDAIWCNNRNITDGSYLGKDSKSNSYSYFGYETNDSIIINDFPIRDNEVCPNVNDRFSVKGASLGNKALNYSVGILNRSEFALAGSVMMDSAVYVDAIKKIYLYTGIESKIIYTTGGYTTMSGHNIEWSNSPFRVDYRYSDRIRRASDTDEYAVYPYAIYNNQNVYEAYVRPSIVLNKDIKASSGSGTVNDPYIVE